MERIKIRRARKEDSKDFLKLVVELANFEKLEPPSPAARRRITRDIFEKKRLNLVLAASNVAGTVGYALYFYTYSSFLARPTLYLEDLYVSKEFRGKKIGRDLFTYCVREAARNRCGRMEWAVLTWNKKAIDFYERRGARRLAEWYYYRLDGNGIERLLARER
ncbi:MAG TPA: GNAT family N-acetyltransferase [Nitrososphaerales archaeon]|nr:GNAT family N-acetyltransferase [Nitrososphaerales archaeon]